MKELLGLVNQAKAKELFYSEIERVISVIESSNTKAALTEKITSMTEYKFGARDTVIMLHSFDNGVKRLKTNQIPYDHERQYEYKDFGNGLEKYSKGKNLIKAHFKWNYGTRYTLSKEETKEIRKRILPIYNLLK